MRLLAVDGNSIMNRAFYGIKLLSNKKGAFTNAILGFMNIYLKAVEELKPDSVAVAFDLHAPTFRHKAVTTYKANRKGMPPELREQMPKIKELLTALGIRIVELEGYEADDILGTISKLCKDNNSECFILTGDRDNLQLINDKVSVRLATTKETILFTPEKFNEVYGLEPLQLIDLKALMGDSSDNIPGVAGIGEKTATTLITEYGSVENLYENLDSVTATKSVLAKLENGKDAAFQSKWLATIVLDVPIENNLEYYKLTSPSEEKCSELLTDLEMYSLLERLNFKVQPAKIVEKQETSIEITEKDVTEEFLKQISDDEFFVDMLFCDGVLKIFSCSTVYTTSDVDLILKFFSGNSRKSTFGAKPCYKFAFSNNTPVNFLDFDADIAGYLLNSTSSEYSIEKLCSEYSVKYHSELGENADIVSLHELTAKLSNELSETKMNRLFYDIELPLTEVLSSMEVDGILIDESGVREFGDKLKSDLTGLEKEIFNYAGREFNISSPKQLGDILFEELGLPSKKKTKTGYSTNAEVLEGLRDKHPIIELILQFRQLSKLNSTYVEGLLKVIGTDGRIHTSFKQTETRTGRISSTEPNMQNIPVRTELGRNMRRFFIAKDDSVLLDADYSQIELRILAAICDDKTMQNAFISGQDIHATTASQVFDMPIEMVTSSMRRAAKAVNFGIIYGIGAFSLSKDIGVSVSEADKYIKEYLEHYPNVSKYMEETVNGAMQNGYVTTIFGRRRYIAELASSNKMLQAFGKRAAMNAPIQGSAADIIKIAMVKVYQKLKEEKLDARLILQVHDELIVESSQKDSVRASQILQSEMENAINLSVPLTADVNIGRSWYDAKG